jgi:membrane-bound serine protease (ClpP class)
MIRNNFFKTIFTGALFVFFVLFLLSNNIYAESPLVVVAVIEDEIKAGIVQYLQRVINAAEEKKADYIIIKLDTPGGLLKATENIVDLILETEIRTIVFVHKEGGWAYSAGTFILMSADYAIVHPRASIGAARPVILGGVGGEPAAEKIVGAMTAWMKSLAEMHGRNEIIAEKFIREDLALTGLEAKEEKVIDETAKNLDELFLKVNILEPIIKIMKPTFIERFFNFLSHPYLISLFLTIGGLSIIMAIRSGEFEITGIVGIIALLIGFWGMGIITFSFLGIGLILFGLFLLLMEMFGESGFGLFGIAGIISIVFGIFTFGAEPFFAPELFDAITMAIIGAALFLCLFFVIIGRKVAKAVKSKPKTGTEALIGLEAEVLKELNPRGYVKINQEIWSAKDINENIIFKGTKVEIIKIEGNTLIVKSKIC